MDYTKNIVSVVQMPDVTTEDIAQAIGEDVQPSQEMVEAVQRAFDWHMDRINEVVFDIILGAVERPWEDA